MKLLMPLLGLIALIALALSTWVAFQNQQAQHESCVAIANLDKEITISVQRARKTLPTITYYQQHPDELRTQEGLIHEQLVTFRPRHCN